MSASCASAVERWRSSTADVVIADPARAGLGAKAVRRPGRHPRPGGGAGELRRRLPGSGRSPARRPRPAARAGRAGRSVPALPPRRGGGPVRPVSARGRRPARGRSRKRPGSEHRATCPGNPCTTSPTPCSSSASAATRKRPWPRPTAATPVPCTGWPAACWSTRPWPRRSCRRSSCGSGTSPTASIPPGARCARTCWRSATAARSTCCAPRRPGATARSATAGARPRRGYDLEHEVLDLSVADGVRTAMEPAGRGGAPGHRAGLPRWAHLPGGGDAAGRAGGHRQEPHPFGPEEAASRVDRGRDRDAMTDPNEPRGRTSPPCRRSRATWPTSRRSSARTRSTRSIPTSATRSRRTWPSVLAVGPSWPSTSRRPRSWPTAARPRPRACGPASPARWRSRPRRCDWAWSTATPFVRRDRAAHPGTGRHVVGRSPAPRWRSPPRW